ncbi:hypothetical protein LOZ65_005747 [Ophidiomyces ophidiicola]|nr:hypothetical protein LOZ65_005747 [Ophidiomyces ophidiicola]
MDSSQLTTETTAGPEAAHRPRRESHASHNSQTAADFINEQLQLEADAREALPYSFDSCTRPLGALRQSLFSCLTCNPAPSEPNAHYTPAGICYSCSISCHGEHSLVELFNKRNFVCDCGTSRFPSTSSCTLRSGPNTRSNVVHLDEPIAENRYNQNFQNRFCCCGEIYDPHQEKGTMFQCLGLGDVESGGCGEDWYHPECLVGIPRGWNDGPRKNIDCSITPATKEPESAVEGDDDPPLPPGFPAEADFETFICYKCLRSNLWLKRYAGTAGFLPPVFKENKGHFPCVEISTVLDTPNGPRKRSLETNGQEPESKRPKSGIPEQSSTENLTALAKYTEKHDCLPSNMPLGEFSLFLKEDFRDHICHCATCFPLLIPHPQLREEEETYEPPLSDAGGGDNAGRSADSQHTGSLLDRGEAALSNLDRVRAIEGVMVYNHLKNKVKEFLTPFAESGTPVGAEDIKAYFEKLRGDDEAIREAGAKCNNSNGGDGGDSASRREQNGY